MKFKRVVLCIVDVIGKCWALPYTLIGLFYGLLCHGLSRALGHQSSICVGNNAVQFLSSRGILNGAALTLGNVILYGPGLSPTCNGAYGDCEVNLGRHEQAHTYQYQLLGPLFVPVYFLCGGIAGPSKNPLERAAQDFGARRNTRWC